MVITAKWIHKHKTAAGGWTAAQLIAIGVSWPPFHGWIGKAIGQEISEQQRRAFEADSALVKSRTAEE